MKQRTRIHYIKTQKAIMWERWKAGEFLHQIVRLFDRNHSSIQKILQVTGGIRPTPRGRSPRMLTLAKREEILRCLSAGQTIRSIASWLGRAPSTISREVSHNGGCESYRARQADQAAWDRALRPKRCKLIDNPTLARMVAGKLQLQWPPEQIAGWLKQTYSGNEHFRVLHETIYRSLFIQARGALKKGLLKHLRRTRAMRRSRHYTQKTDNHGRIVGALSISERSATVEDLAVPRHWEGDLLSGSSNSHIATLVERHYALCHAGEVGRQRYRDGGQCLDQTG